MARPEPIGKLKLQTANDLEADDGEVWQFPQSPNAMSPNKFDKNPKPYDMEKVTNLINQKGRDYTFFFHSKITLNLFYCFMFGGMGYHFATKSLVENAVACAAGYFVANMTFMAYHIQIHMLFVNTPMNDMDIKCIIAFLHHYVERKALSDFYVGHRLSYLTGIDHFTMYGIFYFVMGQEPWVRFMPFVTFWLMFVGMSHEWYHLTSAERREHFPMPFHFLCTALEMIGIISTKDHKEHHEHDLGDLEEVVGFFDMWMPGIISVIFEWLWLNSHWIYMKYGKKTSDRYYFYIAFTNIFVTSYLARLAIEQVL